MDGLVALNGERGRAFRVLVWEPVGKRSLGRPGVEGIIIIKGPLIRKMGKWAGFIFFRKGASGELL
jgi:hypothetical protein